MGNQRGAPFQLPRENSAAPVLGHAAPTSRLHQNPAVRLFSSLLRRGASPPHPLRCGLLEEKACRALPPTGDTLTAKPPPNIRHPRIKPSRKPQKVQETQCRKTGKGVGQAFLPPLGRQIHRRQVSWAEPEISGSLSLMPQLHSELHMPGLGDTAVICTDTATAFMELIT